MLLLLLLTQYQKMLCPKGKDYPKQPKAKTCFIDPLFLTQMELKVVKWLKAKKEQESH